MIKKNKNNIQKWIRRYWFSLFFADLNSTIVFFNIIILVHKFSWPTFGVIIFNIIVSFLCYLTAKDIKNNYMK